MRAIVAVVTAAAGLTLAGCTKQDGGAANTAAMPVPSASTTGAAANFTPPTSISRADYGGRTERRFRKLDKNGDGKLQQTELPEKRAQKLMRRMDKNGDGAIDATEWSQGMLARFDKMDANHDGNLTSDEHGKRGDAGGRKGGGRRGGGKHQGEGSIDDEGDEVDNGF